MLILLFPPFFLHKGILSVEYHVDHTISIRELAFDLAADKAHQLP